jgi:SseB protein C-terminal domain/SseB protein N-terminal domain
MAFTPENNLERALMRAANEPGARPEFYRLLLESELYVIGKVDGAIPNENGLIHVAAGAHLSLAYMPHDGHDFSLAFSSLARLQAFASESEQYIVLKGRDLFENTRGAYFMLNPGADYGKELLPQEIANLLDPKPTHRTITFEKETPVLVGQPEEYPRALMDALVVMFKQRPDVLAAYIAQIAFPGEDSHPLIGVETIGDWAPLSSEIGRIIDAMHLGLIVDVLPIKHDEGVGGFSRFLLANPPFYTRELPKA